MENFMKRFHVHMHVDNLAKNIAFYSAMFDQPPTRTEVDYAKWMLTDPPVNFAISTRGATTGIDHLGIQVDSEVELDTLKARATKADMALLDEGETTCCYARSNKYWVTDPQGMAWEQFLPLGIISVFREGAAHIPEKTGPATCCTPGTPPSATVNDPAAPQTTTARFCC